LTAKILTSTQERFLTSFFRDDGPTFYLSGGTALSAFYLRHRRSDDLDFFTRDRAALAGTDGRVARAAEAAGLAIERVTREPEAVRYFLSGDTDKNHPLVKCELMFDPPPYFADPVNFSGIWVDDLRSIAINKLTIITRMDPKDYFDRYFIDKTGQFRFEDLIAQAKQKLLGLDDLALAAHFKAVDELPNLAEFQKSYMVMDVDLRDIVHFFQSWAARLFSIVGR
jgi:predicted nucleotidyltransferase component of viral defense system